MNEVSSPGNLPNLIIMGAMKAGTTSLHYYLDLHPDICMSRQKELDFFIAEKNWGRGVQWYQSNFVGQAKIYGESSPNYTNYPMWEGVPQRMFSVIPNTKLIYLVRNPIERTISHYLHSYSNGRESRSINQALMDLENNQYIGRSRYFLQLKQYRQFFPDANILVLTLEELSNFPQSTVNKVLNFLGLGTEFVSDMKPKTITDIIRFGTKLTSPRFKFDKKFHQSNHKTRRKLPADNLLVKTVSKATMLMPDELRFHAEKLIYWPFSQKVERPKIEDKLRIKLLDYLAEDINDLRNYVNHDFSEWDLE